MTKKLFVALLGLLILLGAAGMTSSQGADARPDDGGKTTVGKATGTLFYNLYPRMTGEEEFYLVMEEEDLGRAQAVAEAVNNAGLTRATALSGNLVRVTVPNRLKLHTVHLASQISQVEVVLPDADRDDRVPTNVLINLLKKDPDDLVRINAAISLGRREEMNAYAALARIAEKERGWVRRGAMFAISRFQERNAKNMHKWRGEFLVAVNKIFHLLQRRPVNDKALKKQVEELRAAFGDVHAYYRLFESHPGEAGELSESMKILRELMADAAALHPDEERVKVDKLLEAAARGITEYLDKFCVMWDKEEYRKFQEMSQGKFVGIGVFIHKDDEGFIIVSPIFGSPAYNAGLKARDRIVTVNGEEVKDLDVDMLRQRITGEKGTAVKIGIMRKGWEELRVFDIKRGLITLPLVLYKMLPGDVGYLRLLQFAPESPAQMQAALDDLKKQGMKALVLDLRNNPGGMLQSALKIASMFLPKGVIVTSTKGRKANPQSNRVFYTDRTTRRQGDYPIIVMINGASASASELLTGALRDHKRATALGQRTFGKGCGQNIFPLVSSRGERFVKLTVFKYYLPGGECIHEVGITPHIEMPVKELEEWQLLELEKIPPDIQEKYIQKHFEANRELFEKLAERDGFDEKRYPGFEQFYESLDTKLDKDIARRLLRNRVRAEISNRTSKPFSCDLQEDTELQRAAYELLGKLEEDPSEVEGFKEYGERVRKAIEEAEEK